MANIQIHRAQIFLAEQTFQNPSSVFTIGCMVFGYILSACSNSQRNTQEWMSMAVTVTRLKNMIHEFKITMEAMSIKQYIGKIRRKLRKINKFTSRSKKREKNQIVYKQEIGCIHNSPQRKPHSLEGEGVSQ